MRFVLDNSVAMRWLFRDGSQADMDYARAVLSRMTKPGAQACAAGIWPLEAANVIVRAQARETLSTADAAEFIELLETMPIAVDTETAHHALGNTLHYAERYKLSAYDAAYLELALREGIPLATLDANLINAMESAGGERFRHSD